TRKITRITFSRKRENSGPRFVVRGSQDQRRTTSREPRTTMTLPDPLQDQHRYIPNASEDVREMLGVIGVDSIDRLFETIPGDVKLDRLLDIPGPWSEIVARRW